MKYLKKVLMITLVMMGVLSIQSCIEQPKKDGKTTGNDVLNDAKAKELARGDLSNKNINPKLLNQIQAKKLNQEGIALNARYKVPVSADNPFIGEKDALITIVEYSEFQCPFCSKVEPTLKKVLDEYAGKVKLVWKNNPLGFHDKAMPAAIASHVIHKLKGNEAFWKAHDIFYENQKSLTDELFVKTAKDLGIDETKFKEEVAKEEAKQFILKEQSESNRLGARGTPGFFINGKFLSGAQPFENFKKLIDEEITYANEIKTKSGVSADKLYEEIIKNGLTQAPLPQQKQQDQQKPQGPDPMKAYFNDITDSPFKGEKDALVTIVEFSEFQCPFCSKVGPTMKQILEEYKGKVKIVWRDNPLGFHPNAMPAATVARTIYKEKGDAAFWKAHDIFFENQKNLNEELYIKTAKDLGVSEAKIKEALEKKSHEDFIKKSQMDGAKVGARGTPAFFINGRFLSGAQPFENFKKLIDEELAKAEEMVKKGTSKKEIYNTIMKTAEKEVKFVPQQQQQRPQGPDPIKAYFNDITDSPFKGEKDALVTIVEFSEFQCPFCSKVGPTMKQILEEYKGKVKIVWKDNPLGFHPNAMPAATVARTIYKEKGDAAFWKAHDIFFENQKNLNEELYIKTAKDLGVSEAKIKEALEKKSHEDFIKKSQMDGAKVGARGTPAFFINGRFLSGAQPFENFKKLIDEELAKAEEMVKKGTAKKEVYNTIMKTAEKEVKMVPQQQGQMEDPNKIYNIPKNEHSPFFGPKDAKVVIVEFSEFQCPFCSRVIPTVKKLKEKYGDKIRFEFRHLPLPFHNNAMNAAKASMAAHKQGKFWEMHDMLFENQKNLTVDELIGYASKLKLDVKKFEADMKDPAIETAIKADMDVASKNGANGTPTFFINGKQLVGAQPYEAFETKIEEALKSAK